MKPPTDIAGYDPTREADGFSWDGAAAQRAVDFFPECLVLTTSSVGGTAGKPFILQPWQRDFVATLFGWKRKDGGRRYRESCLFVPRKNGKTETGAGLALYGLCCDNEQKAEVYSAAFTREQSSRVFEPAAIMVRNSDQLNSRLRIVETQKRIVYAQRNSYYAALASEAAVSHGKNPHLVLFDELHAQKNRLLYDGLKTGRGSRLQPLWVNFSTAGHDRHSICWEVWNHARQVRDGTLPDPTFLPCIYEIKEGEDWQDEAVWARCNPNLGVTIGINFLREEFERATSSPAYENTFRNLYLNEWTEQAVRWFSMDRWDACRGTVHASGTCYAGLDLSSTTDITALVLAFPRGEQVELKAFFWIPEETARTRGLRDRVPYQQWVKDGWIQTTPGRSLDYEFIRADVNRICREYPVTKLAIDPWNATQLANQFEQVDGLPVGFFRQGYSSMSSPAKQLETLIVNGDLVHDGNPVLRWMAGNVSTDIDPAGNIKPSKAKSTERIDGIVAAVMAIGVMALDVQPAWSGEELGL